MVRSGGGGAAVKVPCQHVLLLGLREHSLVLCLAADSHNRLVPRIGVGVLRIFAFLRQVARRHSAVLQRLLLQYAAVLVKEGYLCSWNGFLLEGGGIEHVAIDGEGACAFGVAVLRPLVELIAFGRVGGDCHFLPCLADIDIVGLPFYADSQAVGDKRRHKHGSHLHAEIGLVAVAVVLVLILRIVLVVARAHKSESGVLFFAVACTAGAIVRAVLGKLP